MSKSTKTDILIQEPLYLGDHPLVITIYGERTDPNGEHQVFGNDGIHQSFRGNEVTLIHSYLHVSEMSERDR